MSVALDQLERREVASHRVPLAVQDAVADAVHWTGNVLALAPGPRLRWFAGWRAVGAKGAADLARGELWVAGDLPAAEAAEVLAHEAGHALGGQSELPARLAAAAWKHHAAGGAVAETSIDPTGPYAGALPTAAYAPGALLLRAVGTPPDRQLSLWARVAGCWQELDADLRPLHGAPRSYHVVTRRREWATLPAGGR
jgi:hypothetical protein